MRPNKPQYQAFQRAETAGTLATSSFQGTFQPNMWNDKASKYRKSIEFLRRSSGTLFGREGAFRPLLPYRSVPSLSLRGSDGTNSSSFSMEE